MKYIRFLRLSISIACVTLILFEGKTQCTNTTLFPPFDITASHFNDTTIVAMNQWAGEYYVIKNLAIGETYEFMSSTATDYITIRDADGIALLAHGSSPLSYAITGDDILTVHINLVSPPCGAESVNRTTSAVCTSCASIPPGVGINISDPDAVLDVAGEIKLGNSISPPSAGMIRWNTDSQDFEGYTGSTWVSLTQANSGWGVAANTILNERIKATSSDGATGDYFGDNVSISGDYAIVGAYADDDNGSASGSAYIFHRSGTTWTQQSKLLAADGATNDFFGNSVSISGDYAIVGAYADDDNGIASGSAYIFHRSGTTWTQQAKLLAADRDANDFFGYSVSISGYYALIGAWQDDDNGPGSGSAYIFHRTGTNWTEQDKLLASDGAVDDYFGNNVSLSGDYAIVGAPYDDDSGYASGSAYIFHRSGTTWTEQDKLLASDGAVSDYFGNAVSISSDYAIVGAQYNDDNGNNSGSAYIFNKSGTTWTQQVKLLATDGDESDYFGISVSISGDYAIVGAHYNSDKGYNSGSAYIYHRLATSWTEESKLLAADGAAYDFFGISVSISGDYAIVGADGDDDNGNHSGSVYFFGQ